MSDERCHLVTVRVIYLCTVYLQFYQHCNHHHHQQQQQQQQQQLFKNLVAVLSNRIKMKFGRIVLQVNAH